jgi:Phage integrase family
MVSFPGAILPELQHHLDTYSLDGPDGLVFVNEHGQPWHRGNFNTAVRWREVRERIGVPNLHLHDLRHTGNTLAAQSGASLRDLMTRMGHDSPAAALINQHSSWVADEAIAAALNTRLAERKSRPVPNVGGTRGGPDRAEVDRPLSPDIREKRLLIRGNPLERMTGIEPALSAWEADVLPLNYIRVTRHSVRPRLLAHPRCASNVPQCSRTTRH